MKLICFPHAGGFSAYYRFFMNAPPEHIDEVCLFDYPRYSAKGAASDFDDYIRSAVGFVRSADVKAKEYVIFGHSMGGFVACEAAQILQNICGLPPCCTIISGQNPPYSVCAGNKWCCPAHERGFLEQMGGIPDYIRKDSRAYQFFLNYIRFDMKLLQTYRPRIPEPADRLDRGMVIYGKDDLIIQRQYLKYWERTFKYADAIHEVNGRHFYFDESMDILMRLISQFISDAAASRHPSVCKGVS